MKEKKELEVNVDLSKAEKDLEKAKKNLKGLIDDAKAVEQAMEGMSKQSAEAMKTLLLTIADIGINIAKKDPVGVASSILDGIINISEESAKSIPYLERLGQEVNNLLNAELALFQAKQQTAISIEINAEKEIEYRKRASTSGKMAYAEAKLREEASKKIAELYKDEKENLKENIFLYNEIGKSIDTIQDGVYKKSGTVIYEILGERKEIMHWKTDAKKIDKILADLTARREILGQKILAGKTAEQAEAKATEQANIAASIQLENRQRREAATEQQRQAQAKAQEERARAEEARFQRYEQLQIEAEDAAAKQLERKQKSAQIEADLRNQQVKGLETVSAVEINVAGMQQRLAEHRERTNQQMADSEADSQKSRISQWQGYLEEFGELMGQINEVTDLVGNSVGGMFSQLSQSYTDEVASINEKISTLDTERQAALEGVALSEDERRAREEELAQQKINLENATSDEQKKKAEERIATLKGELSAEENTNKEFDKKKADLEKEKEKKEKKAKQAKKMQDRIEMGQKIVAAVGHVAAGVTKALGGPFPINIVNAAIVGAAGAVQVGIMTKQLAKMEDGGLLRGKRHSQGGMPILGSNIEVEGGEYVVNRESTGKNLGLIRYINSQRRQLSPADISDFFNRPNRGEMPQPAFARMFREGGQLPPQVANVTSAVDRELLDTIKNINFQPKVSVTDINSAQEDMVKIDNWVGM